MKSNTASARKAINDYLQLDYQSILRHIEIDIFRHSKSMYGLFPRDVLQAAVLRFLERIDTEPDYLDKFFVDGKESEAENLRGYVVNSLKRNAADVVYDIRKKHNSKNLVTHAVEEYSELRHADLDESGQGKIEYLDVISNLSPSFKRVVKSIDNGDSVQETIAKVGLPSVRAYYVAQDNLKLELEMLGVSRK